MAIRYCVRFSLASGFGQGEGFSAKGAPGRGLFWPRVPRVLDSQKQRLLYENTSFFRGETLNPDQIRQVHSAVEKIAFRKVRDDEPLLSTQLIDSIGFVDLVVELEREFRLKIDVNSVSERNFNTVGDIIKFLETRVS